jgi:hypothetical protein
MRKHLFMKKSLVFVLFFPLAFLFFCGGKRTTRPTEPEYEFTINGVVVKDLSIGKDIAYFTILRDSVAFDSALVKVGQDTIKSQGGGSGIYSKEASHLFDFGDALTITVSSAEDDFTLRFDAVIPGYFRITSINHRHVTAALADDVVVTFNASANASGYFISVVRPDGSNGYTDRILADEIPHKSVLRDAFNPGDVFTHGTYLIYLVSYYKSFLRYPGMGFYLPAGLPEDDLSGASGTIGVGVVAPLDSVEAVPG